MDALGHLNEIAKRKGSSDPLAIILKHVIPELDEGESLGELLTPYIPATEAMVLKAGEASGSLNDALDICARLSGTTGIIIKTFLMSLIYPAVLTTSATISVYLIGTEALPNILSLMDPSQFTGMGKLFFAFILFLQGPFLSIAIPLLLILFILVIWSFPKWTGKYRIYVDKIPPYSIYRHIVGAGWLLAMAAFLESGIGVMEALVISKKSVADKNPWLTERINGCLHTIPMGLNLAEALDVAGFDFPDRETIDDLLAFATLPTFEDELVQIGSESIDQTVRKVKLQSAGLSGFVLLFFASFVIGLYLGVQSIIGSMGAMF